MLSLISDRLKQHVCDDVMEVAWSTLWNVTDETAINCQYFLDWDGMTLFCACLEVGTLFEPCTKNNFYNHRLLLDATIFTLRLEPIRIPIGWPPKMCTIFQ